MSLSPTFIQQMYVAYFGRPADPGGLAFYATFDEASLVRAFADSPESQALYGAAIGPAAVNAVYQNLFNRGAEPAGLSGWSALLVNGDVSLAGLALAILRGARNDDLTSVTNKVVVATLFTSHVDTIAEAIGYAGSDAAAAARNFLKTVGSDMVSLNAAQNNVDKAVLTVVTPLPTTAQSFPLTAGSDTIIGGTANDTIGSSTAGYFGSGDSIDGGTGSDTLAITGETADITGSGITVANVEAATLTTSGAINLDTTGWSGLTTLTAAGTGTYVLRTAAGTDTTANAGAVADKQVIVDGGAAVTVNAMGVTTGSVTVGSNAVPSGAIVVNATGAGNVAMGNIFVKGGTSVTVNQAATNAVNTTSTNPAINVVGTAATTAVTLNAAVMVPVANATLAGVTSNTMTITDVNAGSATQAGTITSVTAGNFSALTINDSALANLTLTSASGNVNINNGGLTAPTNRTLNVNIGSFSGSALADANVYTTINLTTSGAGASLANIFDTALTTLNVGGTSNLYFFQATGMTGLQTAKVTGSASLSATFSGANAALTSIDTTGSTGASSFIYNPTQTSFTGGSGADSLSLRSATLGSDITLGDGNDKVTLANGTTVLAYAISAGNGTDVLEMAAADAAAVTTAGTTAFSSKVTGFEQLSLSSASGTQVVDLALLGSGFTLVGAYRSNADSSLTLNHFASGATLGLYNAGTGVTVNGTDFSGADDTLALQIGNSTTTNFTSTGLTAAGVENFAISTYNGNPNPAADATESLTLLGNDAKTITATSVTTVNNTAVGSVTLALTAASTALTRVDASGMPTGSLSWTSGALANAAVVKGSAQGNDVISLAADTHAVTFTGGTGNVSITTGSGDDIVNVGGGANIVNVGSGTDRVNITAVNAASATTFTTITGLAIGGGDTVSVGGNVNAMGSQVTDLNTTLVADLNAAAADTASSAAPVLHWFNFGGDTYIVKDVSAGSNFVAGTDMVVKLTGVLDIGAVGVGVAGGVITL